MQNRILTWSSLYTITTTEKPQPTSFKYVVKVTYTKYNELFLVFNTLVHFYSPDFFFLLDIFLGLALNIF